ncbi:hypothetical protein LEMLEM_LOCUS121, partial [Lemmus lemmus]
MPDKGSQYVSPQNLQAAVMGKLAEAPGTFSSHILHGFLPPVREDVVSTEAPSERGCRLQGSTQTEYSRQH